MKRIFVIDDDALMCEVVARSLARHGFEAEQFTSAEAALDAIRTVRPDLIVSDVNMPRINGISMLSSLQEAGVTIPAILMTAHATDEVRNAALRLGIHHIFRKPIKEMSALVAAAIAEIGPADAPASAHELDTLRMGLLTDLSHQLRTPITAMKLAMEGLFAQVDVADPGGESMVAISRRNIDRIVALVENQLELLEMTLGEVTVSRRRVDIDRLIESVADRLFDGDPELLARFVGDGVSDAPRYLFTDPDRLDAILTCLLCGGPPSSQRELRVSYDNETEHFHIVIRLNYLGRALRETDGVETGSLPALARMDFEHRAYTSVIESLGGHVMMEKDRDRKEIRMSLPVMPGFDRIKDVRNPVRQLESVSGVSGEPLSVVSFTAGDPVAAALDDQLQSAGVVLSDAECVLRGPENGHYSLVLLGRSDAEVARIVDMLDAWTDTASTPATNDSVSDTPVADPASTPVEVG